MDLQVAKLHRLMDLQVLKLRFPHPDLCVTSPPSFSTSVSPVPIWTCMSLNCISLSRLPRRSSSFLDHYVTPFSA
jgi:hypothetical protein